MTAPSNFKLRFATGGERALPSCDSFQAFLVGFGIDGRIPNTVLAFYGGEGISPMLFKVDFFSLCFVIESSAAQSTDGISNLPSFRRPYKWQFRVHSSSLHKRTSRNPADLLLSRFPRWVSRAAEARYKEFDFLLRPTFTASWKDARRWW